MHEDFQEFLVEQPTVEYPKPETMAEAVEWWSALWRIADERATEER
jgi:hypothetical protein